MKKRKALSDATLIGDKSLHAYYTIGLNQFGMSSLCKLNFKVSGKLKKSVLRYWAVYVLYYVSLMKIK